MSEQEIGTTMAVEAEPLFLARLPEGAAEFVVVQAPHHPTLLFFGIVDPAGLVEVPSLEPSAACVRAGFCLPPEAVLGLAAQLLKWAARADPEMATKFRESLQLQLKESEK